MTLPGPLVDLASRALGGSVMWASDELFAPRESLINPAAPVFDATAFSAKGKVYDGWESRRRRGAGNDSAIIRLGAPGVISRVVCDTAYFAGNYPPEISVEGMAVEGFQPAEAVLDGPWDPLVPRSDITGDAITEFDVTNPYRYTHVRLSTYPDGGVARLRVLGRAIPDPALLAGTVDLAATENGGTIVDCSNEFYGSPSQLLMPDRARTMGEGWENARRRQGGNDHVTIALGLFGAIRRVELDTSYFVGNAPAEATVTAIDARAGDPADPRAWTTMVGRRPLVADTRHPMVVDPAPGMTHVRVDVFPDGGLARVRVHGDLDDGGRAAALLRWWNTLPPTTFAEVCRGRWALRADDVDQCAAARPMTNLAGLPAQVRSVAFRGW